MTVSNPYSWHTYTTTPATNKTSAWDYWLDSAWKPKPRVRPDNITINALAGTNAAVAEITYDTIKVTGESKRNKGEQKDPEVALDLAVGRALRLLGDELVSRGYERLDEKEN